MALDDLLAAAVEQVDSAPAEDADTGAGADSTGSEAIVLDDHAAGVIHRAVSVPTDLTIVSPDFLALLGTAAQIDDLPAMDSAEGSNSGDMVNADFSRLNSTLMETIREDSRKVLDTVDQLVVPAMYEYIGVEEEKRSALNAAPLGSPASAALAAVAAARGTEVTGMADQKLEAAIRMFDETYPEEEIAAVAEVADSEKAEDEASALGDEASPGGDLVDKMAPVSSATAAPATGGYGTSPLAATSLSPTAAYSPATALSSALPAMGGMAMGMPFVGTPISASVPGASMGGFAGPYAAMPLSSAATALAGSGRGVGAGTAGVGTGATGLGGSGVSREELRQMVDDARKRIESERGTTRSSSADSGDRPSRKPTAPQAPSAPSSPGAGGDRASATSTGGSGRELGSSTALRGQTVSGGMVDKAMINSGGGSGARGLATPTPSSVGGGGGAAPMGGMRGGMPMGMMPMMGAMGAASRGAGGSGGVGGGTSFDLPEDYQIQDSAERMRGNAVVGGVLRPGGGNVGDGLVEPSRKQSEGSNEPERRTGLFG